MGIPSQSGRRAVVTGTGGLGYEVALALADAGAEVVLAGRDALRGAAAVARLRRAIPAASISFESLDLARLGSVAAFTQRMLEQDRPIHLLVNNAGVMMPVQREETADGFELQFGTNHLGHFALTAGLLPLLRRGMGSRVVSVSSLAHRSGSIRFEDPQWQRRYLAWPAYCQSKLAVLMFALELQRRSMAQGWGVLSVAAHPGLARTGLFGNVLGGGLALATMYRLVWPLVSQSAAAGAQPILHAATAMEVAGGGYYGPDGFREMRGAPRSAWISARARDTAATKRLWELSERLTGQPFA